MVHQPSALTHIGDALISMRAAIDVVSSRAATRVTIHTAACEEILAATRVLARSAGVIVEPTWCSDGDGCDIVIRPRPAAVDA